MEGWIDRQRQTDRYAQIHPNVVVLFILIDSLMFSYPYILIFILKGLIGDCDSPIVSQYRVEKHCLIP